MAALNETFLVGRARGRLERFDLLTLGPAMIVLVAVTLGPLAYLVATSFTPLDLSRPDTLRFIGLDNYVEALTKDSRSWNSLSVQARLSIATVSAQLLLGLGAALLLNRRARLTEGIRAIFIIPMVLPPIVVAVIWKILFNPLLTPFNLLTVPLGVTQPSWLTDANLALWTIVIADVWEWFPFATFIILAALQTLPQEPIEAAKIDGASPAQEFWYVILPLLSPVIAVAGLFRLIDSFKAFPLIYIMTGGGPGTATEPTNFYAFVQAFQFTYIGYSSSLIVLMLIVTVGLSATLLRLPGLHRDVE